MQTLRLGHASGRWGCRSRGVCTAWGDPCLSLLPPQLNTFPTCVRAGIRHPELCSVGLRHKRAGTGCRSGEGSSSAPAAPQPPWPCCPPPPPHFCKGANKGTLLRDMSSGPAWLLCPCFCRRLEAARSVRGIQGLRLGYELPKQLLCSPGKHFSSLGDPKKSLLGWALPSQGLLLDFPGCFVLIVHMHLQRGHLHGCQEMPTSLSIPYNPPCPSLLVSSHSTAPDITRAPFLHSKDSPVSASSWAQPEPRALTAERLSSLACPQPVSSGAELGEPVLVQGTVLGTALPPPACS